MSVTVVLAFLLKRQRPVSPSQWRLLLAAAPRWGERSLPDAWRPTAGPARR